MSAARDELRSTISTAVWDVITEVVRQEVRSAIREAIPAGRNCMPPAPSKLLKVEQVADELQVKRTTVRAWIKSGVLKAKLLGPAGKRREYRIRRSDLDAFVSAEAQNDAPDIDAQVTAILGGMS